MDIVFDALGFAAKAFIIFATVAAILIVAFRFGRPRRFGGPRLLVKPLNDRFQALGDALRATVQDRKEFRQGLKDRSKAEKAAKSTPQPSVFVLDFDGDVLATAVKSLREEVTAISAVAGKDDEVVLCITGNGLKTLDAISGAIADSPIIAPRVREVAALVEAAGAS